MKRLAVHDCGWGEDWPLGQLADDGNTLLLEYAPEALAQGLELSPLHLTLRATRMLTRDEREVDKAYARAVFNVLFHNRDDHPKNFAWRLGRDRRWRLAPAFDLTFSEGPMGQHHMDVCGEGHTVDRGHLLRLASEGGVATKTACATIDRMVAQAASFSQRAAAYPIRKATLRQIQAAIHGCRENLMRG